MFAHRLYRVFVPALLLVGSTAARAYTPYCVGSVPAFNAALLHAESATDETVIELQTQGSPYHIGNTELMNSMSDFNALKILGGYDSTCANRTLNPENTVIDGDGTNVSRGLRMQGTLVIEGVRFQNFGGNGVAIGVDSTDGITTAVRNSEFIGTGLSILEYCGDHDNVLIDNNLVIGAPGDGIDLQSECLSASPDAHATDLNFIEATANTVANNAGKGVYVFSAGSTDLVNNIIWGNSGIDIFLQTGVINASPPTAGTAFIDDNTFDASSIYGNYAAGSSGDDHNDPLFIDPANGNYRLQTVKDGYAANSPAANTGDGGASNLTNVDLDGNPRVVGSAPDRGAYESDWDDTIGFILSVTNTNDSGTGSLRKAITDANNGTGLHFIVFSISGACPQVIAPASDLPYITGSVNINGFTQAGSSQNTLDNGDNAVRCIVLDGGGARNQGVVFTGSAASQSWVQGMAFEGFTGAALNFSGGQNNQAWGNQFGGKMVPAAGGLLLTPNAIDIWLYGASTTATIGGSSPFQRNIIATANGSDPNYGARGVAIPNYGASSSNGNQIVNNLIGMDYRESTSGGNGVGVQVETANNRVKDNVFGNNNNGIQIRGANANGNAINNNRIGLSEPFCAPTLPPLTGCIWFDGLSAPNQAGIYFWQGTHDNVIYSNTIANNTIFGVELIDSGTNHNWLFLNSIYANAAEIDLNGYSYGYNDPASAAPNRGLNYPLIAKSWGGTTNGTVNGLLQSSNGTYSIEAFASFQCDSSGHGPAQYSLGLNSVTISNATSGNNGSIAFSVPLQAPSWLSLASKQITFTATDSAGNTSQISACSAYDCDVIFRHGFDTATGEKCP